MNERRFTVVCQVQTNDKGERVSGCGRGWECDLPPTTCPWCGQDVSVRDEYVVVPVGADERGQA